MGSVLGLSAKLGEELDVGKRWDSSFARVSSFDLFESSRSYSFLLQILSSIFLPFALFESIVEAAQLLSWPVLHAA